MAQQDGGGWEVWGYSLSIGLVLIILPVIVYYCCMAKLFMKLIIRWRRRRRVVRPFWFETTLNPSEVNADTDSVNHSRVVAPNDEGSVIGDVENNMAEVKSAAGYEGPENIASGIPVKKDEDQTQSILGFLNNNGILNNNFRETVVARLSVDEEPEAVSQPPTQIGPRSRVVIFSGVWSSFLGPTFAFLSSYLRSDPLGPEEPACEPEGVGQEIQRLTNTRSAGAVTLLDFCQGEGSPHKRYQKKKSAPNPEPKMEVVVEEPVVETKPDEPEPVLELGQITSPPSSIYRPPEKDRPSPKETKKDEPEEKNCCCC